MRLQPRLARARFAAALILTALTAVALALGGAYIAPAPAQAATAPTAVDDHFEMTAGTVLTVSRPGLLSNDIAPQLDSVLWINNHTEPAQGTLDFSEVNGSFSYTPPAGFVGTTTFTYTPRDYATNLQGNWATVTIEVKPVGQAVTLLPEAVDDTYTYTPKTSLYVAAPGLLGNDALHSGNATVSLHRVISQSLNIAVNSDGSFFFTASNASVNTYSFEYKVCTAVGCSIAQAWLKPTTAGEQPSGPSAPPAGGNAAPTAGKDTFSAVAGAPTVIAAPGLLANDTDPDGDPLTVKSVGSNGQGATAHGTVTSWTAGGGISYTPNPGWHGKDQFSYVLSDGAHDVIGQIEWNVTEPGNYPPVALDDEVSLRSGSEIQLPLGGVLANDTDLDGDALTVTGHGDPAYGTATIAPSGEVTYTPASGFVGQDQLSYMVSDGTATTTGALAIVVTPADAPLAPIVLGNRYRVEPRLIEAVTLAVPAPGLLGNDRSRSGAPLTVVAKTANDHGNILVQADGSFTYSPNQYFTGIASFDYTVSDGTSTATGHVAILVGDASAPADPVPGAFAIAPTPTITGIARVGELLTASAGSWSPAAENLSYQWLRSGTAIAGATGASYRLTAADAGRPISVRTSGDAWGVATTVRISAASQVAPARFTAAPVPKIGGVAKQGRTLTAKAGSWKPGPVTLKYRWLRNGKTIAGATKAKYRLTAKDRGTRISVRVTATKPGYATAVKTSSSKRIAR